MKREEAARFGLTMSETVEGREHNPFVLYAREYRDDASVLDKVLVPTPSGAQVSLSQVADIKTVLKPARR